MSSMVPSRGPQDPFFPFSKLLATPQLRTYTEPLPAAADAVFDVFSIQADPSLSPHSRPFSSNRSRSGVGGSRGTPAPEPPSTFSSWELFGESLEVFSNPFFKPGGGFVSAATAGHEGARSPTPVRLLQPLRPAYPSPTPGRGDNASDEETNDDDEAAMRPQTPGQLLSPPPSWISPSCSMEWSLLTLPEEGLVSGAARRRFHLGCRLMAAGGWGRGGAAEATPPPPLEEAACTRETPIIAGEEGCEPSLGFEFDGSADSGGSVEVEEIPADAAPPSQAASYHPHDLTPTRAGDGLEGGEEGSQSTKVSNQPGNADIFSVFKKSRRLVSFLFDTIVDYALNHWCRQVYIVFQGPHASHSLGTASRGHHGRRLSPCSAGRNHTHKPKSSLHLSKKSSIESVPHMYWPFAQMKDFFPFFQTLFSPPEEHTTPPSGALPESGGGSLLDATSASDECTVTGYFPSLSTRRHSRESTSFRHDSLSEKWKWTIDAFSFTLHSMIIFLL
ncbi:unnamed protein product [Phytomonas sp. EM1]|nr:unnamed protein product [Phytomonas sp. EM1]|eukprot:CCW65679.1 unnamed protein product [Phytomonas sp. isolate EM1]